MMKPWIVGLMCGLLPCMLVQAAEDSRLEYQFPALTKPVQERARHHQFFPQGRATFKWGVTIPVVGISIEDPFEDKLRKDFQYCNAASCTYNMTITPAQARQLVLYQVAGVGSFLAPKNWKDVQAEMGPSGIASLKMLSPDGQQALSVYNSSACVGCGLEVAALYFPEARQQAAEQGYEVYEDSNVPTQTLRLNQNTVAFSYQLAGYDPTHGVGKLYLGDVNYNEMKVTLLAKDKVLATTILNFYQLTH